MKKIPEQLPSSVTAKIRSLAFGGSGVGEVLDVSDGDTSLVGLKGFIPFTIPGETVLTAIRERKPRYFEGTVAEILSPSAERVPPRCPYFTQCGGCELQHLSYGGQLQWKLDMLKGAMRSSRLPQEDIEKIEPIIPGPPYEYRRRITLHINKEGKAGFFQRGSHTVLPIQECPISSPIVEKGVQAAQLFAKALQGQPGTLQIEADHEGYIAVFRIEEVRSALKEEGIFNLMKEHFSNGMLWIHGKLRNTFGDTTFRERVAGSDVWRELPAGAFSQVNREMNEKLVQKVRDIARLKGARTAEDLYAGAGNFAVPLVLDGMKVVAVESSAELVRVGDGQLQHIQPDAVPRLSFQNYSVEKYLRQRNAGNVDLIIADPPRSGLGEVAGKLNYANNLVLISCHLPSFLKDLKTLNLQGWKAVQITPFDMFPQTTYLEILSVYERQG